MKVQNPIIGRMKGSAGGMTGSKVYDKNVLRAKAMEVNNPKTAAQTTQRNFFAQLSGVVATVSPEILRALFPNKPKAMSRRNSLSKQIAEAYDIQGTDKKIDFAEILTLGNASTMDFGETTCTQVGTTITVSLDASVKAMTEYADNYMLCVLVNETLGELAFPDTNVNIETGVMSITAPAGWLATHQLHAIPMMGNLKKDGKIALVGFGTMAVTKRPARQGRNPRTGN